MEDTLLTGPKVAIIVPVYNMERYLRECLDSLVGQTFRDIEIICFNDASTDSSIDILREYAARDERFVIIDSPVNIKQGGGRNAGIRASRAPYIMFVDPDDWVEPDFVEKLYMAACTTSSDLAVCDHNDVIDGTPKPNSFLGNNLGSDTIKIKQLRFSGSVLICECLYSRDLFFSNNLFFPEGIQLGEDTAISCSLFLAANKIVKIDEFLYNYRYRPGSSCRGNHESLFRHYFTTALLARENQHRVDKDNKFYDTIEDLFIRWYYVLPIMHALKSYDHVLYEGIQYAQSTIKNYVNEVELKKCISSLKKGDQITLKLLKHSLFLGALFFKIRLIRGRILSQLSKDTKR